MIDILGIVSHLITFRRHHKARVKYPTIKIDVKRYKHHKFHIIHVERDKK